MSANEPATKDTRRYLGPTQLKRFAWPKGTSGNPNGRKGLKQKRVAKVFESFLFGVNSRGQTKLEEALHGIWRSGDVKLIASVLPGMCRFIEAPPPASIRVQYEQQMEITLKHVWDQERALQGGGTVIDVDALPPTERGKAIELSAREADLPQPWDVDEFNPGWEGIQPPQEGVRDPALAAEIPEASEEEQRIRDDEE